MPIVTGFVVMEENKGWRIGVGRRNLGSVLAFTSLLNTTEGWLATAR